MSYYHVGGFIVCIVFLDEIQKFLEQSSIEISSWFIEEYNFWFMNTSTDDIHSFSLPNREADDSSMFEFFQLKI